MRRPQPAVDVDAQHPYESYQSLNASMKVAHEQGARQGAAMLFAYGVLMLVCAGSTTQIETPSDAREAATIDLCVRAFAHAGGVSLFVAASIKGYLPGNRKKTLQPKSQAYLARILLICLGLAFLWRCHSIYSSAERDANGRVSQTDTSAAGVMFFLGLLGLILSSTAGWAGLNIEQTASRRAKIQAEAERRFKAADPRAKRCD